MKRRVPVGARALMAAAGLVASTGLLVACGDASVLFFDDCEDEMAATRAEFGEPQKIVKGESGLNEWVDFHYWYIGLRRSFDWGTYDNCDVSDTRFEPLPEPEGAAPAGG